MTDVSSEEKSTAEETAVDSNAQHLGSLEAMTKEELIAEVKKWKSECERMKNGGLSLEDVDNVLDEIDSASVKPSKDTSTAKPSQQRSDANIYNDLKRCVLSSQRAKFADILEKNPNFDINMKDDTVNLGEMSAPGKGLTLLHYCCQHGAAEFVMYLLSHPNTDISVKSADDVSAMDIATRKGHWDIVQLLAYHGMTLESKVKLQELGVRRNSIDGKCQIFASYLLQRCKKESKLRNYNDIVMSIIEDTMIDIISDRKSFSEDLLVTCWNYNLSKLKPNKTMLDTRLWKTISAQLHSILKRETISENRVGWHWFANNLQNATLWLEKMPSKEEQPSQPSQAAVVESSHEKKETEDASKSDVGASPVGGAAAAAPAEAETGDEEKKRDRILFDEVLEIVENEIETHKSKLTAELTELVNAHPQAWEDIIGIQYTNPQWDGKCRQDTIPDLAPAYDARQLKKQVILSGNSDFSAVQTYELTTYLSQLLIRANSIDFEFQQSVQSFVNNVLVKTMDISKVLYQKGPLKSMSRCQTKAEIEYRDRKYPCTAQIVDPVRCSLTFNDMQSFYDGVIAFIEYMKKGSDTAITTICRLKNSFRKESLNSAYADIKANVLATVNGKSIICEIQFLLRPILENKKKSHKYYELQRAEQLLGGYAQIAPLIENSQKLLHACIAADDPRYIPRLITTHPSFFQTIDWNAKISHASPILMQALYKKRWRNIKLILSIPEIVVHINWDVIGWGRLTYTHYILRYCNDIEIVKQFCDIIPKQTIKNHMDMLDQWQFGPLQSGAKVTHSPEVFEYIIKKYAGDINWELTNDTGVNLFHRALANRSNTCAALIRMLGRVMPDAIRKKLINQASRSETPVAMACLSRRLDVTEAMLELGGKDIDWSIQLSTGQLLHFIVGVDRGSPVKKLQLVMGAMERSGVLDEHLLCQDEKRKGETPLMTALDTNARFEVIEYLLQTYPKQMAKSIDIKDTNGRTIAQCVDKYPRGEKERTAIREMIQKLQS